LPPGVVEVDHSRTGDPGRAGRSSPPTPSPPPEAAAPPPQATEGTRATSGPTNDATASPSTPDPSAEPSRTSDAAPTDDTSFGSDDELEAIDDLGGLLDAEIVQSASRSAEDATTAPATLTVVSAEQMRLLGITTIAEAINFFGLGITVQPDGGHEGSTATTGRGVAVVGDGGNHLLVLLNGHALNDPWGGWVYIDDLAGIPIEVVDRIEILNGPGSVLYGTSAMYGVVNVVTKDAEAQKGLGASLQGQVGWPGDRDNDVVSPTRGHRMGWGSRGRLGFSHPFALGDRDGEVFVQVHRIDARRPTHTFGPQTPDWDPGPIAYPNGAWGGIGSARREVTGGVLGFRLGGWAVDLKSGFWRRGHLFDYQSDFADPKNREYYGDVRVDVRHTFTPKPGMQLRSRLYGDYVKYRGSWNYTDPDFCPGISGRCESYELTHMGQYGLEEVFEADWFVDGKVVSTFGGDVRGRTVNDYGAYAEHDTGREPAGKYLDYTRTTAAGALFVQQRFNPVRWFGLNAGVRLDLDQLFGAHLSPRAVTTFQPVDGTVFKLMYSEAFRAPLIGELLFADPVYHVSAQSLGGLKPEITRSGEFALEQRLPKGIGSVRAGAYVAWFLDLVGERPLTDMEFADAVADGRLSPDAEQTYAVTYGNIGRMLTYGGYLGAELQTPDRKFRFGTNLQGGESTLVRRVEGERLESAVPIAPQVVANSTAMLVWGGAIPNAALGVYYHSPRRATEDVNGDFVDTSPRRAGHHVQGRFSLTGEIPNTGLWWGAWVDYSLGRRGPYMVGQLNYSDGMAFRGELTPLDRLTIWAGLTWQFDIVGAAARQREQAK
jgi:outer membrane receptor protein involved in Fe transport